MSCASYLVLIFHNLSMEISHDQELYLELKKLEKLAEDDLVDVNWLMNLLKEVTNATFEWMSSKSTIWKIDQQNFAEHWTEFMQVKSNLLIYVVLDLLFLIIF